MELPDFLVKAKTHTYASQGEAKERTLDDGAKEFVYQEGDWKYRDRYFGSEAFTGEEIVTKDNHPVWTMNYYGRVISKSIRSGEMSDFLKESLLQVKPERPFRGPSEYQRNEWKYKDNSAGTIEDFHGEEEIFFNKTKVYKLSYHGGLIM